MYGLFWDWFGGDWGFQRFEPVLGIHGIKLPGTPNHRSKPIGGKPIVVFGKTILLANKGWFGQATAEVRRTWGKSMDAEEAEPSSGSP